MSAIRVPVRRVRVERRQEPGIIITGAGHEVITLRTLLRDVIGQAHGLLHLTNEMPYGASKEHCGLFEAVERAEGYLENGE